MPSLPASPAHFVERKAKILNQLSVPDAEYSDNSPKGSVDEGVRDLISELNALDGLVTTSSCAGRVSVFVEGRKTLEAGNDGQVAAVGGKGAGGAWLFVSHDPVPRGSEDWIKALGLVDPESQQDSQEVHLDRRLIHFKFEPMILHILTASPSHAQLVLRCAVEAGFRESGAIGLLPQGHDQATPLVAVRTMGLGFDSLIGQVDHQDRMVRFVSSEHLRMLMSVATERFAENAKRIDRFRVTFRQAFHAASEPPPRRGQDGEEWEDAAARRERKRAEGLRRKAELEAKKETISSSSEPQQPVSMIQTSSTLGL